VLKSSIQCASLRLNHGLAEDKVTHRLGDRSGDLPSETPFLPVQGVFQQPVIGSPAVVGFVGMADAGAGGSVQPSRIRAERPSRESPEMAAFPDRRAAGSSPEAVPVSDPLRKGVAMLPNRLHAQRPRPRSTSSGSRRMADMQRRSIATQTGTADSRALSTTARQSSTRVQAGCSQGTGRLRHCIGRQTRLRCGRL